MFQAPRAQGRVDLLAALRALASLSAAPRILRLCGRRRDVGVRVGVCGEERLRGGLESEVRHEGSRGEGRSGLRVLGLGSRQVALDGRALVAEAGRGDDLRPSGDGGGAVGSSMAGYDNNESDHWAVPLTRTGSSMAGQYLPLLLPTGARTGSSMASKVMPQERWSGMSAGRRAASRAAKRHRSCNPGRKGGRHR